MGNDAAVRVLRVYHGGRIESHRARERALIASGIELTLVVPRDWPEGETYLAQEVFPVVELSVVRPGDVNRHAYAAREVRRVLAEARPDLLDVHEEPFSIAARQWIQAAPPGLPVVMYTAQNIDKRYPPPFSQFERAAYRKVTALYPCSRQAASVARGKGFGGLIEVLPLGFDDSLVRVGVQSADAAEVSLVFVGRLVPEKGVLDAVQILASVNSVRPARLVMAGIGPEEKRARTLAHRLGVLERLELPGWLRPHELAAVYRQAHVALVPSLATATWVEQFGRAIVEAQASGAIVAAYETGAIPEIAGDSALLVAAGNSRALAERIIETLADAHDFEQRREAGIACSASRTWTAVAAKQTDLYSRVLTSPRPMELRRSPRDRRVAARAEYGPTAESSAGKRPFAVPLVRRSRVLGNVLGAMMDLVTDVTRRFRPWHLSRTSC
jgi:glycosyltransferase involved in cell wall biosynthesis